ncbi:MAG: hypothetical protein IGBAC_0130 [Ignavibacteriae bacterium]|nr:MAG: hypothetical protein IGBAC_0130 [Ignavibacteriota bacterium]
MKLSIYINFIFLIIPACNIFEIRTPENPTQQSSTFVQPVTPDIVIQNLKNSIEDYNIDNYIRCLSDPEVTGRTFKFIPAAVTGIDRAIFNNWTIESERQYLTNLGKPAYGRASLTLTNKRDVYVSSDSVIVNYDYSLFYPRTNQNYNAGGNLQFYISVDKNGSWSIYRWEDFNTTQSITWTYIKAIFSTGF